MLIQMMLTAEITSDDWYERSVRDVLISNQSIFSGLKAIFGKIASITFTRTFLYAKLNAMAVAIQLHNFKRSEFNGKSDYLVTIFNVS